jgi:hypothetical protein
LWIAFEKITKSWPIGKNPEFAGLEYELSERSAAW